MILCLSLHFACVLYYDLVSTTGIARRKFDEGNSDYEPLCSTLISSGIPSNTESKSTLRDFSPLKFARYGILMQLVREGCHFREQDGQRIKSAPLVRLVKTFFKRWVPQVQSCSKNTTPYESIFSFFPKSSKRNFLR